MDWARRLVVCAATANTGADSSAVARSLTRLHTSLLLRPPHALAVPVPAVGQPLEADAPTRVAAFLDLHETRAIAAVAVVVAREQVAAVVEAQLLRVAQAAMHDLEAAAVQLAAQHGAVVREVEQRAFLGRHREAAVADREVEAPVRPHDEPVQVVAAVINRGERPPLPADCPAEYATLVRACWAHDAAERPSFSEIVEWLRSIPA